MEAYDWKLGFNFTFKVIQQNTGHCFLEDIYPTVAAHHLARRLTALLASENAG